MYQHFTTGVEAFLNKWLCIKQVNVNQGVPQTLIFWEPFCRTRLNPMRTNQAEASSH